MRNKKKWFLLAVILILGVGILLEDIFRFFHPTRKLIHQGHGAVGTLTYEPGTQKNLCEYVLPEGFRWRSLMDEAGEMGTKRYGAHVFTRTNSPEQMISLIRWPYHLNADSEDVLLEEKELKRTWFLTDQAIKNYFETVFHRTDKEELFYTISYYIPFFYIRQVPRENRSLILRGMRLKEQKYLETTRTKIWIWYGDFKKLAFDKRQESRWRKYITEVIDFGKAKSGAVALVQNTDADARAQYIQYTNKEWTEFKTIGEVPMDLKDATLFALTTVPQGERLNQEEFEAFLKTIDFNAHLYDPHVITQRDVEEFNEKHPDYPIKYQLK